MHILFLTWKDLKHPHAGGAEKVMSEYAHALTERGHEVTWLASGFPGAREEETIDGIRIIRKYHEHTLWMFAGYWYRRFQKIYPPDIIIDEAGGWPLLSPLYEKRIPIYFFLHHIPEKEFDRYGKGIGRWIRWIYRQMISLYRATPTITVSESTRRELIEDFSFRAEDITVIENATDTSPIESIDMNEKREDIVFLGRLTTIKRPDHAIRAFAGALDSLPSTSKLHIIGNRQEKITGDTCEDLVRELGLEERVVFHGHMSPEQYSKYLEKSRCILVPSEKEGYGLIVLEANAYGLPAIAYDVPGLRDSVLDGENGILIPDGDIGKMSEAIREIFANEEYYHILASKSLEHAKHMPTWSEQREKFIKIIHAV